MVRRDYSGMTLITPDSPNYNRGVLYGVLNAGIEEIAEERYSHMADSKAKVREQNKWRKEELHKFCELFEKYYFDLWD